MSRKSSRTQAGRAPMDSMPVHVNDWLTSLTCKLLGRAGRDIYFTLLCHQWKAEADGLPADPEHLRVLCDATDDEWAHAWPLMEPHFPPGDDGRRRNVRMGLEWEYYHAKRLAGGVGGTQRAENAKQNASKTQANVKQTSSKPQANAKQTPSKLQANGQANVKQTSTPVPVPVPSSSYEEDAPTTSAVRGNFASTAQAAAYDAYRRGQGNPQGFDDLLTGMTQGLNTARGQAATWHQIGQALVDMQIANAAMNANTLRGFVAKAHAHPTVPVPLRGFDPPGTVRDGSGNIIKRGAA